MSWKNTSLEWTKCSNERGFLLYEIMRGSRIQYHFRITRLLKSPETPYFTGLTGFRLLIPTRCRDLNLKQFCLEDIAPATLIILITHIVLAVRWMLIKILSAVINHHGTVNQLFRLVVSLTQILYEKPPQKSRYCWLFFAPIILRHYIELLPDCYHPMYKYTAINQIHWWSFLRLHYREVSQ